VRGTQESTLLGNAARVLPLSFYSSLNPDQQRKRHDQEWKSHYVGGWLDFQYALQEIPISMTSVAPSQTHVGYAATRHHR